MRGGGKHKDKASTAAKKRDRNPKKQHTRGQDAESQLEHNTEKWMTEDTASQVVDKTKAIELFRDDGFEPDHLGLVRGSDEQVEDRIQQYLMKLKDRARMETEEATMIEMTIRWAVGSEERKGAERIRDASEGTKLLDVASGFAEVRTGRGSAGWSSEEEMRGVGRTRPAEVAKREEQEKETSGQEDAPFCENA